MTALYVAPRVPLVDLQTGLANPIWYRLFEQLFNMAGAGAATDAEAFTLMPAQQDTTAFVQLARQDDLRPAPMQFPAIPDDLSPTPQSFFFAADDVMPVIAALQAEVAGLRAEIDDLRKGTVA